MNRAFSNVIFKSAYYFADGNKITAVVSTDSYEYAIQVNDTLLNSSVYLIFETELEAIRQATYHFWKYMEKHGLPK